MPVDRVPISRSQLCGLLEIDPARLIAIEADPCSRTGGQRDPERWWIVLEPEERCDAALEVLEH
jgi:hypothetical protein